MKTTIIVKLQYEALHNWPGVVEAMPDHPWIQLALKNLHRHLFYITLEKQVTHSDRDVEIICFKHEVQNYLETKYGRPGELGSKSCEMIAQELLEKFNLESVEVLEDNENGAKVYK